MRHGRRHGRRHPSALTGRPAHVRRRGHRVPERSAPVRDAAPSNRTVETARAPRGHVPVARLHPSQVVSDNLRQVPVPARPEAYRSVPGPPCQSPAGRSVAPGSLPATGLGPAPGCCPGAPEDLGFLTGPTLIRPPERVKGATRNPELFRYISRFVPNRRQDLHRSSPGRPLLRSLRPRSATDPGALTWVGRRRDRRRARHTARGDGRAQWERTTRGSSAIARCGHATTPGPAGSSRG